LDREDSGRLIVVFGYQWESDFYDSEKVVRNIRQMFNQAVQETRRDLKRVFELDYRPLQGGYGGHLFNQIARDIIGADIAVFETSDLNPNVMIELGVALTWNRRVLPIMCDTAKKPPNDISGQTWAEYRDSGDHWSDPKHAKKLANMVKHAITIKG